MKDFREVCYPMQCQPSSPELSSVGSATACAQCTLFIRYPLPLLVACGLIENAPEEWWVCPFLICFLIWVSRPPIWTFRKVKRSFLSWLLHAVLVIVFPHPSWCFTVTTSLLFSLEKPSWRNHSLYCQGFAGCKKDKGLSGDGRNKLKRLDQWRSNNMQASHTAELRRCCSRQNRRLRGLELPEIRLSKFSCYIP